MRKASNVTKLLSDLTKNHGAQRLSPALRRIEIESIPSSGAHVSHSLFVKKVLPRIKYNNQALEIDVRWIAGVSKKDKKSSSKQATEVTKSELDQSQGITDSPSTTQSKMPVRARLLFDGLPTREINLQKNVSVNEITNELFKVVRETTGTQEQGPSHSPSE